MYWGRNIVVLLLKYKYECIISDSDGLSSTKLVSSPRETLEESLERVVYSWIDMVLDYKMILPICNLSIVIETL
jgi:hypothetical protein